ncbi:HP1 family phage holin [Aromatoleum aromaticum]|nr:HP1 family phage holin [Aromatoleum aromaticum]
MPDKASAAITYTAAGSTVILGMTANEFAALGGLAIAGLAFVTNAVITWWYKREHLKIARARAQLEDDSDE